MKCLMLNIPIQFSVPQIEYPPGGSSNKGSHVYFLLQVFWVMLLFCKKCCSNATMVTLCHNSKSDITIVVPWQLSTGSIRDYLFCCCPLVGILFEVLRIVEPNLIRLHIVKIPLNTTVPIYVTCYQMLLRRPLIQQHLHLFIYKMGRVKVQIYVWLHELIL